MQPVKYIKLLVNGQKQFIEVTKQCADHSYLCYEDFLSAGNVASLT